jgi:glycosyltransferase involved in cell wall biosynthesis
MEHNIKVSIITVCYNSRNTIEQTIESVLKQTYNNIEYLIIDGGSTDGTIDIIQKYEKKFGERLRWISEPDNGIYDAMNKGIDMATGELIGIINSDDWYEINAVESAVKVVDINHPYQIIYGMIRVIENGHESQVYLNRHESIERATLAHPGCFVTKKTYQDKGKYSLNYKIVSDWEFFLRIRNDNSVLYKPLYVILANFRVGGVSSNRINTAIEMIKLKRQYRLCSKLAYVCVRMKWGVYKLFRL